MIWAIRVVCVVSHTIMCLSNAREFYQIKSNRVDLLEAVHIKGSLGKANLLVNKVKLFSLWIPNSPNRNSEYLRKIKEKETIIVHIIIALK